MKVVKKVLMALIAVLVTSVPALAEKLKPFILSTLKPKSVQEGVKEVESKVKAAGFEEVGKYSPKKGVEVIVVTSPYLKNLAAKTKYGAFGAVERIAVVDRGGKVEVSYTNPPYWYNAFRMEGNIAPVTAAMEKALGNAGQFGANEGYSPGDLRDYNYKCCMPKFDDFYDLAKYPNHNAGVSKVQNNLKKGVAGVQFVYRVDIPQSGATLFGVHFTKGAAADAFILDHIDFDKHSHAAHFPYELLVIGNRAIALNAKFRIAISWPDLSMFGAHGFMSIKAAPDAIQKQLKEVATK